MEAFGQHLAARQDFQTVSYLAGGVFLSGLAMYSLSILIHKCNAYFYEKYGVEDSTELISLSDINSHNFIGDGVLSKIERWDNFEKMKRIKEEMSKKLNESFGSTSLFKKQSNQSLQILQNKGREGMIEKRAKHHTKRTNNTRHFFSVFNNENFHEGNDGAYNSDNIDNQENLLMKKLNTPQLPKHQIFEERQEHPSFYTSRKDSMEEYTDEADFDDMNCYLKKIKLAKFLKKYENKISAIALWCGHSTIGIIPTIFCATQYTIFKNNIIPSFATENYTECSNKIADSIMIRKMQFEKEKNNRRTAAYNSSYADGKYALLEDDVEPELNSDKTHSCNQIKFGRIGSAIKNYIVNKTCKFLMGICLITGYCCMCYTLIFIYNIEKVTN